MKYILILFLSILTILNVNGQGYSAHDYKAPTRHWNWAGGNRYYIDATNGNDSNDGLTVMSAWKSIKNISGKNNILQSKDTVSFKRGGIFRGYTLDAFDDSLVFNDYGEGNRPVIDGEGIRHPFMSHNGRDYLTFRNIVFFNPHTGAKEDNEGRCFSTWKSAFLTIDSCVFDGNNSAYQCVYLGGLNEANDAIIINSEFKNAKVEHGLYFNLNKSLVDNCIFKNNKMCGVKINSNASNVIIRNSIMENNVSCGFIAAGGCSDVEFYNNVIISADVPETTIGLRIYNCYDSKFNNNTIIVKNSYPKVIKHGIYFREENAGTNCQLKKNIIYMPDDIENTGSFYLLTAANVSTNAWQTVTIDSNIYFGSTMDFRPKWRLYDDLVYSNFNEWQLGSKKETNSKFIDPLFIDVEADYFHFAPESIVPILNAGARRTDEEEKKVLKLSCKVYLEGAYINGSMRTDLVTLNLLPNIQPYQISPWNYSGNEELVDYDEKLVDWVLVELRIDSNNYQYRRAGLVDKYGNILDVSGSNFLPFENAISGYYFISIKHRNHLSIMSSEKIYLDGELKFYDFTVSPNKAYGNNAMSNLGDGNYGMRAGDADANGIVNVLDYGAVGNNIYKTNYHNADLDLNGIINILDYQKTYQNILKKTEVPN